MQFDLAQCVNKGMQRDYSMDKASQEFAYENKNIRITTTGNNSFLSVTNEKSTEQVLNLSNSGEVPLVLGTANIGNYIIVFSIEGGFDYITRIDVSDPNDIKRFILYKGILGFSEDNPIECTTSYESDGIQKVYWVDGKNQPRYIDVETEVQYNEDETFNFVPIVKNNIKVTIEKQEDGAGNFESGIVQYYITGYKKYGAESNAIYASPLYYISPNNRGGKPGDKQSCSFKLSINIQESNIDHIRVYSVCRFTKNTTPIVTIVQDVSKSEFEGELIVIDTNNGIPIASTDVMFLGGNTIIASTIEQKDNTLFLGNIETKTSVLSDDSITNSLIGNFTLRFGLKAVPANNENINQYYTYKPYLGESSEIITTFKYLEWYRFGIQFQIETLEWTPTYFLQDIQNTINPTNLNSDSELVYNPYDNVEVKYLTMISCSLSENLIRILEDKGIVGWRLMMAQHDSTTRTIKSQGIVLPTQFSLRERISEHCYGTPIWTLGQCLHGFHYVNIDSDYKKPSLIRPLQNKPYNKSLTCTLLPNAVYYNKDASNSNRKNDAYILDNLYCTKSLFSDLSYYCVSITPYLTIDRLYTWDSPEWGNWGSYTGDVFYGELKIKVSNGTTTKEYTIGRSESYTSNTDSNIAYVKKPYGQRKSGCNELSNKLIGLFWSDIGEFYIQGLKNSSNNTIKIKNLSNYSGGAKVFLDGEIPSGSTIREWVSPSSEVWNKSLGELARNFTYNVVQGSKENFGDNFFIDASLCNFISPDIDSITEGMSFRIIGSAKVDNVIADYRIVPESNVVNTSYYKAAEWILHNYKCKIVDNIFTGIHSYPLWPYDNKLYYVNYWNQSGSLVGSSDKFKLKTKKFANMWYLNTTYFNEVLDYSKVYDLKQCENTTTISSYIYKSEYDNLIFPKAGVNGVYINNEGSPINETFPLEYVDNIIVNGNSFGGYENAGTVSIKSKASNHVVFKLPNSEILGTKEVLPNYIPNHDGGYSDSLDNTINADIFGNINSRAVLVTGLSAFSNTNYSLEELSRKIKELYDYSKSSNDSISAKLEVRGVTDFTLTYTKDNITHTFIGRNDEGGIILPAGTVSERFLFEEGQLLAVLDYSIIITSSKRTYNDSQKSKYDITFQVINNKQTIVQTKSTIAFYAGFIEYDNNIYPYYSYNNTGNTLLNSKQSENNDKLFIGEFYVPYNPSTFMGGDTQNAKELNIYIPISGVYNTDIITNDSNERYAIGYGLEGDTYYQRWDHVRISPISDSDVNQPMDALSVMLETHTNLDGDYRTMRGRLDITNINPENTNNVINDVYSQSNNYITSSILDEKYNDSEHSTMYIWSLPKQSMGDIDNWTQIRTSSANNLDGDKGALTKIINWNNKLLAFQEKGISIINYNNQTTISQNEGVPVEIANSGRVTGHYYISTSQGCKNKWSIVSSPYSLYFIDSYNKSINAFNEKITPLSTTNLFSDWIIQNEHDTLWKPNGNPDLGFRSYYDSINKDIYFVNGEHCLCYNELLSQFTSFYDYEKMDSLHAVNGHVYGINNSKLYKMFEGKDYCKLFDKPSNYYMVYKINKDPFIDKTWSNIEYRADVFESGLIGHQDSILSTPLKTFDNFEVWNEYQYGKSDMSKAKCKFRIWREQIPRDTKEDKRGFNRIRNPWIMLKLEKTEDTNKRMEFHDLLIKYLR